MSRDKLSAKSKVQKQKLHILTDFSVLEDVVVRPVLYISDDEGVCRGTRAGEEAVVVRNVGDMTDPVRVEVRHILLTHTLRMITKVLREKYMHDIHKHIYM